jgi:hypothetical protein
VALAWVRLWIPRAKAFRVVAHDQTASSFQTSPVPEAAPVEPREMPAGRSKFDESALSAKLKRINLGEMDKILKAIRDHHIMVIHVAS